MSPVKQKTPKLPFLVAFLMAGLMVACGGRNATPTPEPTLPSAVDEATAAPEATEQPTEPTEEPPAAEDAGGEPEATEPAAEQPDSPLSQPDSPLSQPDSPLAQPNSPLAVPNPRVLEIPEPDEESGIVYGRLIAETPGARSLLSSIIYLAPVEPTIVTTESGDEIEVKFIGLVPDRDPQADLTNDQGEFAILNVPPGEYGIVLWTPVDSYIVPDEETSFLYLTVEAGEALDLGDVVIQRE